ncbi:PaaI family thioesterase [Rhodococcus qingshengii]|uniref:PaaI family thioesterase n=1 Tax=Rhodococcus erythropolis TaxID=1833 RepID=UPI0035B2C9F8
MQNSNWRNRSWQLNRSAPLTFAAGSVLGSSIVTAEFTISYLRPARGALLRARARMNSKSRSQALARCDIFAVAEDGSKTLCAAGQGTVSVIMLRD